MHFSLDAAAVVVFACCITLLTCCLITAEICSSSMDQDAESTDVRANWVTVVTAIVEELSPASATSLSVGSIPDSRGCSGVAIIVALRKKIHPLCRLSFLHITAAGFGAQTAHCRTPVPCMHVLPRCAYPASCSFGWLTPFSRD